MEKLSNIIESIVFLSGRAIAIRDISDKLEITPDQVLEAAKELQEKYSGDCGIQLLIFNKKLQFSSNPAYVEQVEAVLNPIKERELSKAMLEVAAIIAYRQPITRLEIEEVRGGVNSDYSINLLTKQNLIEVVGRKDAIGKPLLFGTTDEFLKRFQLSSLDDLPDYDELINRIKILHAPANSDLFFKEEYSEPEEGQVSMEDLEARREKSEAEPSEASEGGNAAEGGEPIVSAAAAEEVRPETEEAPEVFPEVEPQAAADPEEFGEGEQESQTPKSADENLEELELDELPDVLKDEENLQIID